MLCIERSGDSVEIVSVQTKKTLQLKDCKGLIFIFKTGAGTRNRTRDTRIFSQLKPFFTEVKNSTIRVTESKYLI